MAAMLNWVNQNMDKHIVTIEDPIEYTFQDDKSLFQQREIGLDVPSFQLAIKRRAAPESRHHPDRRNARPRNVRDRHLARPRPATWCSPRCTPRPWRSR